MADGKYILDGHDPKPAELLEWARWFETNDRKVARDTIGDVCVSTVFLGIDHRFGDGPPLIFESLVFGGPLDQEMRRYSTWDEAVAGHAELLSLVRASGPLVH
jgi:hypothetical protein